MGARLGLDWSHWFGWMVWTTPVALFFIAIALLLAGMTLWEIRRPTTLRKGWLPMATTRGDRLFIGLLLAAFLHLAFVGLAGRVAAWLQLDQEPGVWIASAASVALLVFVMRKG